MRCRICLDPLTTARYSIHSLFDFLTVEGIRISIAAALREIFPTLQEVNYDPKNSNSLKLFS